MDNFEDGRVKFITAFPDLTSKLKNYGYVTHNEETDLTTVTIQKNT